MADPLRTCHRCGGPVREVWGGYGFLGSMEMLYVWLQITEAKPSISLCPNAWMCDTCRIAGGIPPPLTPEEEAENARRWAEIEASIGLWECFWRGRVQS